MKQTKIINRITNEYLEIIDNRIKLIPLTFDLMFKNVFENNITALKRFLISVLHLEIEPEDCNLTFDVKELPLTNYYEYKKTLDIHVTINDSIYINLELNRTNFNHIKRRNFMFHNKNYSLALKKGNDIDILNQGLYIQLNLNAMDKSNTFGEDKIVAYSTKTKSIYIDNYLIYLRYIDYYRKLYYTNNELMNEDDYWLAALSSTNFKELNEILSKFLDDKLRIKIIKDVIRMSDNESIIDEFEQRTLEAIQAYDTQKYMREEALKEGHSEGMKQGIKEGIEKNTIDTIKTMLDNNLDYQIISKVSKKTIKEIKEIEKSMQ